MDKLFHLIVVWLSLWYWAPIQPVGVRPGSPDLFLNGLPVYHYVQWFPAARKRFSYYFEDRYGNLHLMRARPESPAPRQDPRFRDRRIYPKPVIPRLAPGEQQVYYFVDVYDGLVLVTAWRPLGHHRLPPPIPGLPVLIPPSLPIP